MFKRDAYSALKSMSIETGSRVGFSVSVVHVFTIYLVLFLLQLLFRFV